MTKGKFGLSLAAIAVIAFGFVALRQPNRCCWWLASHRWRKRMNG